MLVLTRKLGQSLILEGPGGIRTVITIDEMHRGRVRIVIDAPPEVKILRAELDDSSPQEPVKR